MMPHRLVRGLFAAGSTVALAATVLAPPVAIANDSAVPNEEPPDGWVRLGSNLEAGIGGVHVLADDTVVVVGDSDQSRTQIFVRTSGARSWQRRRPGGRCTASGSVASDTRVLVTSDCWDKFDSWSRADVWTPKDGWTKKKVPGRTPVWKANDGRLGAGRLLSRPNGKSKVLPKLPLAPISMAGAPKGSVYALGTDRARVLLTRWRPGRGWSKPSLVRKAGSKYAARQAHLTVTRGGDIGVGMRKRLLTRRTGAKKWSSTFLRPRKGRKFQEAAVVASEKHGFTALWIEGGKAASGKRRAWIRARDVSASGAASAVVDVDDVAAGVVDETPWLNPDVNNSGDIALGYKVRGKHVPESVLRVRTGGDWSDRVTVSQDKSTHTAAGINAHGCVVGVANISVPEALAGSACSVAHPVTDDRAQLPAPTSFTGLEKGRIFDLRTAKPQGGALHVALAVRVGGSSGNSRVYLTTRKDDGTNGSLHRVKDPTGTYKSCRVQGFAPVGDSVVARYRCGRAYGKNQKYVTTWTPGAGWSKPADAMFSTMYGDLNGKLLVGRSGGRYGLYDPAKRKLRSFPAPPLAIGTALSGITVRGDGTALAYNDEAYSIYDGEWSKKMRTPLNRPGDYATDWYYDGGTLVAYDLGAYRIRRNDGTWTPRRKTAKGFPEVRVLSSGQVVQISSVDCSKGRRVAVREFDRKTGKLLPGVAEMPCGRVSANPKIVLGEDGDLLATMNTPLQRFPSVYYLPSPDSKWSKEYAANEIAYYTEVSPIGNAEFATRVDHVPYLGSAGLAVWDLAE